MSKLVVQIILAALIVCIASCQVVITQDYVIDKNSKLPPSNVIKFEKPEWNNVLEFAVYGWIRPQQWINGEVQIFRLSANKDINSNTLGDRVLKAFAQDNSITFETYDSRNWDPKVQHPRLVYGNSDFGKWIYIYQGYSPEKQKTFGFVRSSQGDFYNYNNNYAVHSTSNFYQLIYGMQQQIWNGDRVDIKLLQLAWGKGAYRENNFDFNQTPVKPGPSFKCINLFPQCGFKGQPVEFCGNSADTPLPVIKSIFVPSNFKSITIYPKKNYQGEELTFKKSFECLDPISFQRGSIDIVKGSFFTQIHQKKTFKKTVKPILTRLH